MTKKKKIGIVTYWESYDNYGQQLQCWALQHYLRSQGYDAFLIRFKRLLPMPQYTSPIKYLKRLIWHVLYLPNKRKDLKDIFLRQFPLFRMLHLKTSLRVYRNLRILRKYPPEADIYITGSDQVWRPFLKPEELEVYFLRFGNDQSKRISYAPSIGQNIYPKELVPNLKKYLSHFNAISVRERSGVTICKSVGYDAEHVLDPTLLLSTNDYLSLSKGVKKDKSIFIYSLNYSNKDDIPFEEIKQYAYSVNLPIKVTTASGYLPSKELFVGVNYSYATIGQWISNINNAEIVVTASFHGIVICVLLHKNFIYTPLSGEYANGNVRVSEFLTNIGLKHRIWHSDKHVTDFICDEKWEIIDKKIENMKIVSYDYLNKNL